MIKTDFKIRYMRKQAKCPLTVNQLEEILKKMKGIEVLKQEV